LAIDLHHLVEVSEGGGDTLSNLIALCPNCHALHHRGTIHRDALYAWKGVLVALGAAFDREAVDRLLFLSLCPPDYLVVSGDGLLHYSRLIAAGLAGVDMKANNAWQLVTYAINISNKGRQLIDAWKTGDRELVRQALTVS
jgi:Cys-tRNA synthase (O-phospho-L-seryl-tRNA:Cys-tRNA synthase)